MLLTYGSPMMHRWILFGILPFIVACTGTVSEKPKMQVEYIVSSSEPIEPGKPFPEFTQYFATGTTVVYSYVWLKNYESQTGTYIVRMRWHYPNDFHPPMMQHTVTLSGQNVAQFSFHDENGIKTGPYMLDVQTGKDEIIFSGSGSARFFVGMSESAAAEYLREEAEYKQKWEQNQAEQAEVMEKERKAERELEEKLGWEKRMTGSDEISEADQGIKKQGEEELPPSLA